VAISPGLNCEAEKILVRSARSALHHFCFVTFDLVCQLYFFDLCGLTASLRRQLKECQNSCQLHWTQSTLRYSVCVDTSLSMAALAGGNGQEDCLGLGRKLACSCCSLVGEGGV